jgi:dTMP kinase
MKRNIYPGKLIVFTGVDGSGKTTHLYEAKHYIESKGDKCFITKMPSDRIRKMYIFHEWHNGNKDLINNIDRVSLITLASGDRLLIQDTEIIPALKRGEYVLCDRYTYTGLVFSNDPLIKLISGRFIKPDLVFLTHAKLNIAEKRVKSREDEKNKYYDRVEVQKQINKYWRLAEANNFIILNTEDALIETIRKLVFEIENRFYR